VIKIDKNPNYKASKLQELIEVVKLVYERYLEKDLPGNKDDEDFPFPLKKVAKGRDVDQLEYESNIIVEIKSDPILFRTFNDLIWKIIFNDKSPKTYNYFFSFIEWLDTVVFNTMKLTSCKIRKRKRDVKTHTRLVNGARLEYAHVWEHVWNPSSHLGHPRKPSNPAYRVTYLYVLPYLSLYVLSYLRKHDYSIGMKEYRNERVKRGNHLPRRKASFLIANL
jgi:hypothetical protein